MVSRFTGRNILSKPTCPFCGMTVLRPKELTNRMTAEMPVGTCSCGAVYAFDVTGHNLGTAMIEALVFGCGGDWDLAWDLVPEEDYMEGEVKNYDIETHLVVHGGAYEGRRVAGTLYFVRLNRDKREVTAEGDRKRTERRIPISPSSTRQRKGKKSFSKKEVESLVKAYQVEPLLTMAAQDKRIIRDLQRLLYSVDKLLRWRAADVLGRVSAVIAIYDPGAISKLLQRLFTAPADTAASSWGYLDAVGDIISNCPDQFGGYLPQLYQYARDRALLPDVLRALGKIGASKPDLIRKNAFQFVPLLGDPDPEIRGYAAILLGNLRAHEAKDDLAKLQNDATDMDVYRAGKLEALTLGKLASEALEKL